MTQLYRTYATVKTTNSKTILKKKNETASFEL